VLRILGETLAPQPSRRANAAAALRLVDTLAGRLDLDLDRFHRVQQVFLDATQQQDFALWFSLVYRSGRTPQVKIYFNPAVQGTTHAPRLVAEALRRLGLDGAYATILAHGVRPGQLGVGDRFAFFALDLHDQASARIKVYLSHHDADADDIARAAGAATGVDRRALLDFLELTGCAGPLTKRCPVSGYTFVDSDTDRPSTYSLYLPIRDYVSDDEQARERTMAVLDRFGLDRSVIDRAITAVARRPLRAGVGLIPHLSLRLTADQPPGVTVYLSAEAYHMGALREPASAWSGSRSWS
jgi:DMATS type aromatic prenyltransferase